MNSTHSVSALLVKRTTYPWVQLLQFQNVRVLFGPACLGGYIHTASIVNCVPVFGKLTNIDIRRYFIGHTTGRVILLSPPANWTHCCQNNCYHHHHHHHSKHQPNCNTSSNTCTGTTPLLSSCGGYNWCRTALDCRKRALKEHRASLKGERGGTKLFAVSEMYYMWMMLERNNHFESVSLANDCTCHILHCVCVQAERV